VRLLGVPVLNSDLASRAPMRLPLMETPLIAGALALAAGSMDGFTFFGNGTFATVQSGNVIQVGYWIVENDLTKVLDVALSILAFGLGAAVVAAAREVWVRKGLLFSPYVLLTEAAVLGILGIPSVGGDVDFLVLAYVLSFLAGMQGNAFHRAEGMLVGNVAVTLNVQLAFNFFARALFGQRAENLRKGGLYALVLLGFGAGGVLGGYAANHVDVRALWVPSAVLLALGVFAIVDARGQLEVDPGT
jgi:uncharacterized membrane protein YoaK (UPF0700 family)